MVNDTRNPQVKVARLPCLLLLLAAFVLICLVAAVGPVPAAHASRSVRVPGRHADQLWLHPLASPPSASPAVAISVRLRGQRHTLGATFPGGDVARPAHREALLTSGD